MHDAPAREKPRPLPRDSHERGGCRRHAPRPVRASYAPGSRAEGSRGATATPEAIVTADADRFAAVLAAEVHGRRSVDLPVSGRRCEVPVLLRTETPWPPGERIPGWFCTVPNKVPLSFRGRLLYPELIVLRLLEDAGWRGVWVKYWGRCEFWTDVDVVCPLPATARRFFDEMEAWVRLHQHRIGGCWDVFAWGADGFALVESKQRTRRSHEGFQDNQLYWLEAALAAAAMTSLFVVEYAVG